MPLPAGINTKARDYSPRLSSDGQWLLFASERNPALDTPEQARTAEEIETIRKSVYSGLGNIYRLPISALNLEELRRRTREGS